MFSQLKYKLILLLILVTNQILKPVSIPNQFEDQFIKQRFVQLFKL